MAILDRFGAPIRSVSPFSEVGTSGTAVFGGYIMTKERSAKLFGSERYRTASDIVANISIVAASVRYFLNLLAHPKWKVDSDDDKVSKANAEFVEEVIHDMDTSWARMVRRSGFYRFHGFGIQEWIAKKRDDGRVGLKDIESRPQHTIERWQVDEKGTVQGVWQRSPQTGQELGLPRSKIVYLIDDTLTDSPEGMGWFRHLVDPAERLKTYLQLEGYGFQRDLSGTPIGRAPLSKINELVKQKRITQETADQMVQGIKNFVQIQAKNPDTGVLLDSQPFESLTQNGFEVSAVPMWGLELLTGQVSSLEGVGKAIDRLTYDMARIIGTEDLLVGGDGDVGSRALSQNKSRNLYLNVNSTLADMAEQIGKDVVDPIWTLNGLDEKTKPKLVTEDVSFKDVEQIARVLRDVAVAGKPLAPDDPAGNDLRDLMGISREPELDEETLGMLRNTQMGLLPDGSSPLEAEMKAEEERSRKKPNGSGNGVSKEYHFPFLLRKYDPDQPRDDQGQWADAGGGGGDDDNRVSSMTDAQRSRLPYQSDLKSDWQAVRDGKRWVASGTILGGETSTLRFDSKAKAEHYADKMNVIAREANEGNKIYARDRAERARSLRGLRAERRRNQGNLFKFDPDQPRDDQGQWTDGGGGSSGGSSEEVFQSDESRVSIADERYSRVSVGDSVAGLEVQGGPIPNTSSIDASLLEYEELGGIRVLPMADFSPGAKSDYTERVRNLAEQIKTNGKIKPLIVVVDNDGPYILEGSHRFDALHFLDIKAFPAKVVVDTEIRRKN